MPVTVSSEASPIAWSGRRRLAHPVVQAPSPAHPGRLPGAAHRLAKYLPPTAG